MNNLGKKFLSVLIALGLIGIAVLLAYISTFFHALPFIILVVLFVWLVSYVVYEDYIK